MMEVDIHCTNGEYNFDHFTLGENEDLVFYIKEGEKLTRFYSSEYCPDRGSGTYTLNITARNIEHINAQTENGTSLHYQMEPRFSFNSSFYSDETHDDWTSYIIMQGRMGDTYHAMSAVGFRSDVVEEFSDKFNNASGEEMEQAWQDVIDSDAAFVKNSNQYVKFFEEEHPDAVIYMGIVEKE